MEIETHKFKKQDGSIEFDVAFDDLVYTNATEQYQIFGKSKQAFSWFKDNTLIPYAQKLIDLGKFPGKGILDPAGSQAVIVDDLIILRNGGNQKHLQGTWIHPKLDIVFARWLDDEFAIWCDEKISDLLANGIVTLQKEDRRWVDIIEGMRDCKPGNAWHISQIRELLLIHEKEGYHIRAFKDMVEYVMGFFPREDHPKIFKNMRKLIKQMYEDGELSRTSHESMLEYCVDTVVKVLEKEVRRKDRIIAKFEIGAPAPTVESVEIAIVTDVIDAIPSGPSISEISIAQKKENDKALADDHAVYDAEYLYGHKILGLDPTIREVKIKSYLYGDLIPVCEAVALLQEEGLKLSFSHTLFEQSRQLYPGRPDFKATDRGTKIGAAIWFNKDGSAFCKMQKTISREGLKDEYKTLAEIDMFSLTNIDPAFWTGTNKENTIRITFQAKTGFIMVYGYSSDKK